MTRGGVIETGWNGSRTTWKSSLPFNQEAETEAETDAEADEDLWAQLKHAKETLRGSNR